MRRTSWLAGYVAATLFENAIRKTYPFHIIKKIRWKKIPCNPKFKNIALSLLKVIFSPLKRKKRFQTVHSPFWTLRRSLSKFTWFLLSKLSVFVFRITCTGLFCTTDFIWATRQWFLETGCLTALWDTWFHWDSFSCSSSSSLLIRKCKACIAKKRKWFDLRLWFFLIIFIFMHSYCCSLTDSYGHLVAASLMGAKSKYCDIVFFLWEFATRSADVIRLNKLNLQTMLREELVQKRRKESFRRSLYFKRILINFGCLLLIIGIATGVWFTLNDKLLSQTIDVQVKRNLKLFLLNERNLYSEECENIHYFVFRISIVFMFINNLIHTYMHL